MWANFQRIIVHFTQKIVTKLSKYGFGVWDPGSRIQGSKSTGSRIPDPDPQHWKNSIHVVTEGEYQEVSITIFSSCAVCNLSAGRVQLALYNNEEGTAEFLTTSCRSFANILEHSAIR
jgi:hypothetical protein